MKYLYSFFCLGGKSREIKAEESHRKRKHGGCQNSRRECHQVSSMHHRENIKEMNHLVWC